MLSGPKKRKALVAGGVGAAVALVILVAPTLRGGTDLGTAGATATALVERRTLVQTETVGGTLDFGPTRSVAAGSSGTVTSLAEPGTTLGRGEELFSIDLRPVVLLFGDVPVYRDLHEGVPDGPDVSQLEANLAELGYFSSSPDGRFSSATARAVAAWQRDRGAEVTGEVRRGDVVFLPGGVRVAGSRADLGAVVQPETAVVEYTLSEQVVRVGLEASQGDLAQVGEEVSVRLPDRTTVGGTVSMVTDLVESSGDASGGTPGQGGGQGESAVREATITLDDVEAAARYTTASVDVEFTRSTREDVLAVPVEALLAVAGGGYALETPSGDGTTSLIEVRAGMFADGYVEVSGEGLEEDLVVLVPA